MGKGKTATLSVIHKFSAAVIPASEPESSDFIKNALGFCSRFAKLLFRLSGFRLGGRNDGAFTY